MKIVRLMTLCLLASICCGVSAQWNMRVVLKNGDKVDYPIENIEEVIFVDENGDVVDPVEKAPIELLLSEGGAGMTRTKAQTSVNKPAAISKTKSVKVFMTKFGGMELARDEQTNAVLFENAEIFPTQAAELSFYKSLPSHHWLLDYTQAGNFPLKYYPTTGEFDFFAYSLDGAKMLAYKDVPDYGRTIQFEIDGTQDVMAGKTKNANSGFSANRAEVELAESRPVIQMNHALARLGFRLVSQAYGYDLFVKQIKVNTPTIGTLRVTHQGSTPLNSTELISEVKHKKPEGDWLTIETPAIYDNSMKDNYMYVLPQQAGAEVVIDYELRAKDGDEVISGSKSINLIELQSGTSYLFRLKFSQTDVILSDINVSDFKDSDFAVSL